MYTCLFESLLSILSGLYLGVELPSTYFSTQVFGPLLLVNPFKCSNAHEMSECLLLWGEHPLPESTASASDHNKKKAKKFNKTTEIVEVI